MEENSDIVKRLISNSDKLPDIRNANDSKVILHQWLTALNTMIPMALFGLGHGYTSILIQQLKTLPKNVTSNSMRIENGEFFSTKLVTVDSIELQSWIASTMVLFMIPSCWILILCSKRIGRKPVLLICIALLTVSWMMLTFANDVTQILIGRSSSGLCLGILAGMISIYLGEFSLPRLRSVIINLSAVFYSIGVMISHAMGAWLHWRTTAFICGVFTVIALLMILQIPESPMWLVSRDKLQEALKSWIYLRGLHDLDELESMCVEKGRDTKRENCKVIKKHSLKERLIKSSFLKPLGIILVLFVTSQVSGMGAVTFYCIQLMTEITKSANGYYPALILDTFRLLFSVILVIASKKYGSRSLTLFSSFNCSILLILLSISVFCDIWTPWLSLMLLFGYEIAVTTGLIQMPFTYCSELFPIDSKEIGVGLSTSFNYTLFFIVVKTNPFLVATLQTSGIFLLYGVITLVNSFVLYLILPDTRNKTLREIEVMFDG